MIKPKSDLVSSVNNVIKECNSSKILWGGGIDREGVRNQFLLITRVFFSVVAAAALVLSVVTPISPIVVVLSGIWLGINIGSLAIKAFAK